MGIHRQIEILFTLHFLFHLHSGYLKQAWVLSVYRNMRLLIPNMFCLSFMLLRLVAFGVGSCIIMGVYGSVRFTPLVKQYECTQPGHIRELSFILSSFFLNINGSLLSVAFLLFFHLDRMIVNSYGQI